MKEQFLILMVVLCGLTYSCQKCELIEQIITYPPVDTMGVCEGVFYMNKSGSPLMDITYTFNNFNKPIPNPFALTQLGGPYQVPTTGLYFPSNYSAFDSINQKYCYEYYTEDAGGFHQTVLHIHDIATNTPTFSSPDSRFSSPVYLKGILYAIRIDVTANSIFYGIVIIDQTTGEIQSNLTSGSFNFNSPFTTTTLSSVSDGNDLLYFLSGTNLIEAKVSTGTSRHIDIDPTFDPIDNNVTYYGLEYKEDDNILIAMLKLLDGSGIPITDLVSIDISSATPILSSVFNIAGSLPAGQDVTINNEYYSTTYDQCDNTYYITERQPPNTTNFIEINLDRGEFKIRTLEQYNYGLELGIGQ